MMAWCNVSRAFPIPTAPGAMSVPGHSRCPYMPAWRQQAWRPQTGSCWGHGTARTNTFNRMFSGPYEEALEAGSDVWMGELASNSTAQAQSLMVTTKADETAMLAPSSLVSPPTHGTPTDVSHFGILGGDEDFLDLLERPLLHEDMQRLMEIEQELRIDASCREAFPEVVGSPLEVFSLEDTIEDLNEVIQKEMGCPQAGGPHIGSMQNSFEEKTYIKLECPPSSYPCAASQSYGSLPETEQSFSFCDQVSFFENFRSHMMTSGSPSGYSSEGSIPGSPRSPLSSSMSSCSDLESEVMSSGEVAGSAPTPSVTASEKAPRSRRRRCQHLWEFIIEVIRDPRYNPSLIRWVDKERGIFKIVKSQEVAKLWGARKGNATMSYEYMSRAMRHYYNNGILKRVYGKRLVYQFGPRAFGWDEQPKM